MERHDWYRSGPSFTDRCSKRKAEGLTGMRASAFWAGRLHLALRGILEDTAFAAKSSLIWIAAPLTRMSRLYRKAVVHVPAPETANSELRVGFKATQ